MKYPPQNFAMELEMYEILSNFRKPLFDKIIQELNIFKGSKGLDAGCGIGFYTEMLGEKTGSSGNVTGLDLSDDLISYARNKHGRENIKYVQEDVNSLPFNDNSFDWIWSVDTVWPGPKKYGCPAENPKGIINEYYRVLKPEGSINILFWSTQKLLPGYPSLEARLNNTNQGIAPFRKDMDPSNHIMNAKQWLYKAGFKEIKAKTFAGNINSPLSDNERNALYIFFHMLWGNTQKEIGKEDWDSFQSICNPESSDYILNKNQYYGFYTYSMFSAKKQ